MNIALAIVDANMFTCIGLQKVLAELIPQAEVEVFRSYEELIVSEPERFVHYFVSSGIYFEHAQYFLSRHGRSIVLVQGDAFPRVPGLLTLDVCQDEVALIKALLQLQNRGHGHQSPSSPPSPPSPHVGEPLLTRRETEVAVLLAKGCQSKEVAERLSISTLTATTHRKSIMQKLKANSLADIVLYVVINGLVSADEL